MIRPQAAVRRGELTFRQFKVLAEMQRALPPGAERADESLAFLIEVPAACPSAGSCL